MKITLPPESKSPEEKRKFRISNPDVWIDVGYALVATSALPLALSFQSWSPQELTPGLSILLVFLAMALLGAGWLAVVLRIHRDLGPDLHSRISRAGARGGTVITLLGGGVVVLVAGLANHGWTGSEAIADHPFHFWFVISLILVPVVAFSSVTAILFSFILHGGRPQGYYPEQEQRGDTPGTGSVVFVGAVILALCLLASPLFFLWVPPREVAVSLEPELPLDQKVSVPVDPSQRIAPEFHFSPAINFETSPAHRWDLQTRKRLSGVNGDLPMRISPDGNWLAYLSEGDPSTVILFDLRRFQESSRINGMDSLIDLAWSPDSTLLFSLTGQKRPFSFITRIAQKETLPLPLPPETSFPSAAARWWSDFEIAFFPSPGTYCFLDLVEMRLHSIENSSVWKNREKDDTISATSPTRTFPQTRRARLEVAPLITAYRFPGFQQNQWAESMTPVLAVSDEISPHHRFFPEVEIRTNDRFLFHEDASKLVRWRDGSIEVFYFGLKSAEEPAGHILLPDHLPDSSLEKFREDLSQGEVCAFICAPRTNPLTGQVIGPDRERVKALAILGNPSGGRKVPVWVAEMYQPLVAASILGDFHRWNDGQAELIAVPFKERWWTELLLSDSAAQGPNEFDGREPPARARSSQFLDSDGHTVWKGLRYPSEVPDRKPKRQAETESTGNGRSFSLVNIPVYHPRDTGSSTIQDEIRSFIRNHYDKMSRMDFDSYLDDYTEFIVYHGKPGRKSEDLVPSLLSLKVATSLNTHLSDTIQVSANHTDNKDRYLVDFSMQLSIESSSDRFRIVPTPIRMGVFKQENSFQIVSIDRSDSLRPPTESPQDPVLPEVRELIGKYLDDHMTKLHSPDQEWIDQHVAEPVDLVPEPYRFSRSAAAEFEDPETDSSLSVKRLGAYHLFPVDSGREHFVAKCLVEIPATGNPTLPRKFFLLHWIHLRGGTPFVSGRARTLFHP